MSTKTHYYVAAHIPSTCLLLPKKRKRFYQQQQLLALNYCLLVVVVVMLLPHHKLLRFMCVWSSQFCKLVKSYAYVEAPAGILSCWQASLFLLPSLATQKREEQKTIWQHKITVLYLLVSKQPQPTSGMLLLSSIARCKNWKYFEFKFAFIWTTGFFIF